LTNWELGNRLPAVRRFMQPKVEREVEALVVDRIKDLKQQKNRNSKTLAKELERWLENYKKEVRQI